MDKTKAYSLHIGRGMEQGEYPGWVCVYDSPVVFENYNDAICELRKQMVETIDKLESEGKETTLEGDDEIVQVYSGGKVVLEGGVTCIDFVRNSEKPW